MKAVCRTEASCGADVDTKSLLINRFSCPCRVASIDADTTHPGYQESVDQHSICQELMGSGVCYLQVPAKDRINGPTDPGDGGRLSETAVSQTGSEGQSYFNRMRTSFRRSSPGVQGGS